MEFESTITEYDIRVTVEIVSAVRGTPTRLTGHPDTWHESEPDEIELDLRDYKGRRNAALFDMIGVDDLYRLEDEAIAYMESMNDE